MQLRPMTLSDADSWDTAFVLLSQLEASLMYCAAAHASITWACLEKQCDKVLPVACSM